MLSPTESAARYQPREQDVPVSLFRRRLEICVKCPRRAGVDCNAAGGSLCSILARRKEPCPEFKWPGDKPKKSSSEEGGSKIDTPAIPPSSIVIPVRKSACVLPAPEGHPILGPVPAQAPLDPDAFPPLHPRYLTRNLICHLYPLTAGQKWRRTIEHLAARKSLWNGSRLVTVARDHNCDSFADVAAAFLDSGFDCELLQARNDPSLGETVAFHNMLSRVMGTPNASQNITFYCHGKGATWPESASQAHEWADVMWSANLDYPRLVENLLSTAAVCGAFRRTTRIPASAAPWHFSGTFFWMRHDALEQTEWQRLEKVWSGIEGYPGTHFAHAQSACLFLDEPGDLYHADYWDRTVRCAFRRWKESRA